jgi:hypothetical protein
VSLRDDGDRRIALVAAPAGGAFAANLDASRTTVMKAGADAPASLPVKAASDAEATAVTEILVTARIFPQPNSSPAAGLPIRACIFGRRR